VRRRRWRRRSDLHSTLTGVDREKVLLTVLVECVRSQGEALSVQVVLGWVDATDGRVVLVLISRLCHHPLRRLPLTPTERVHWLGTRR
jgi:hypothetical protein